MTCKSKIEKKQQQRGRSLVHATVMSCMHLCSQLEYATANGRSGIACTDEQQRWNRDTIQNLEAQRLENISFKWKCYSSTFDDCNQLNGGASLPEQLAHLTHDNFVKCADLSTVSKLFKLPGSVINTVYQL